MLTSISCIRINDDGERMEAIEPIQFKKGLNALISDHTNRKTAIAAMIYLNLIDFAFGGNTYTDLNKCKARSIIGEHIVRFTFTFSGEEYTYSRDTRDSRKVFRHSYGDQDCWQDTISVTRYRDELRELYGITDETCQLDKIMKPFTHIYPGGRIPSKHYFNYLHEGINDSILPSLEYFFNKGDELKVFRDKRDDAGKRLEHFRNAQNCGFIDPTVSDTEYQNNEESIRELSEKSERMEFSLDEEISEETIENADAEMSVRKRLSLLYAERNSYASKLRAVENNIEEASAILLADDFSDLQRYFPEVNIKMLSDVERFHRKVAHNMREKMQREKSVISERVAEIEQEIRNLEQKERQIGNLTNISRKKVGEYRIIDKRISKMKEQNKTYRKLHETKANAQSAQDVLCEKEDACYRYIAENLNAGISELAAETYSQNHTPTPTFKIEREEDSSVSAMVESQKINAYMDALCFELALLNESFLPYLIYDGTVFDQICKSYDPHTFIDIMQKCSKQIFAVFNPRILEYSNGYEYSETFKRLSNRLYQFYGEDIYELLKSSRL